MIPKSNIIFGFILCVIFILNQDTSYSETKQIDQNPAEQLKLAKNMEDFGYLKSAEHYYKLAYKNPTLDKKTRKELEQTMAKLKVKIEKHRAKRKPLKSLENLPHFKNTHHKNNTTSGITKPVVTVADGVKSQEFPSPRINKKKWFLATVAIIGIGLIINKKIKDNKKTEDNTVPNEITIGF
jgi:hypothetical protein